MASAKKSSFAFLNIPARLLRIHGDLVFLAAFFGVVAYAALLFYQFLYPPLFLPAGSRPQEVMFDSKLYQKVTEHIEKQPQELLEQLQSMPRDPFR